MRKDYPIYIYLVSLVVFIISIFKLLNGYLGIDIPFGDDSMYLFFSRFMHEKIFPDYGPVYVGTLYLINIFCKNLIDTYVLARVFHLLFPAIALLILLYRVGMHPILAAILSIAFISNQWIANFGFFNPMISHPAIAWIFLWMALTWKWSIYKKSTSAILLSVFIMYYRPEQILTMLLLFLINFTYILLHHKGRELKKKLLTMVGIGVFSLFVMAIVGKPIGAGGKRSGLAILQHVSLNYLQHKGDKKAWEHHVYYMDFLPEMLGLDENIKEMPTDANILMQKGKPLIIMHLKENIKNFLFNFLSLGTFLSPYGIHKIISIFVFVLLISYMIFKASKTRLKILLRGDSVWNILILLAFVATISATSLLIYPRIHYFLFVLPLFYYCIIKLYNYNKNIFNNNMLLNMLLLVFSILFIYKTPSLAQQPLMKLGGKDNNVTHIPAINTLNKLAFKDTINILDRDMGLFLYMPRNYKYIDFNHDSNFETYIKDKKINLIYLNNTIRNDAHFTKDSTFLQFVTKNYNQSFNKIKIPNTSDYFLVSKDLR